jgi:hypothetical protein
LCVLSIAVILLTATGLSLGGGVVGASRAIASDIAIVDTLGVDPSTTFSTSGSAGTFIGTTELVGPQFTLSEKTEITEIGGFINARCRFPAPDDCPAPLSITVQIRPSVGGRPDFFRVLATFVLSDDGDPLVYSYESASMHLVLKQGTYFAMFAAQNDDYGGDLLTYATIPFTYQPGVTVFGFMVSPTIGFTLRHETVAADYSAAARILGHPVVG